MPHYGSPWFQGYGGKHILSETTVKPREPEQLSFRIENKKAVDARWIEMAPGQMFIGSVSEASPTATHMEER
jgi:hypothetical protein